MPRFHAVWSCAATVLTAACVVGCGGESVDDVKPFSVDPATLRPVSGTVKAKGKPLAKVVVAFFAANGVPSQGETDAEGRYSLETMGNPGAPPGEYKVVLSYILAPDGSPQGLGARSAMVQSDAMRSAKEAFPPEYADINKSRLKATVDGARPVDFDLDVDPKPPTVEPKPEAKAVEAAPSPKSGPKAADAK